MTVHTVPMAQWGKDHWSLLAYVETLCVDTPRQVNIQGETISVGTIDSRKVRCNKNRHLVGNAFEWRPEWGTRLKGFFEFDERANPETAQTAGVQLTWHDDWDCLDDLSCAGLVDVLSMANGFVTMTSDGLKLAATLRAHKAQGGQFANFVPPVAEAA